MRRENWPALSTPRIYQARRISEMNERLDEHGDSLVLVEADRSRFGDVLAWLTIAARSYPQARFAVLLDRAVALRCDWQPISDSLREAGAHEVVASPRNLRSLLALGQRHAALRRISGKSPLDEASIEDRWWALLPWQDE
jgi:hypothetical protein